jgi:membrane-associated protease RseP (regulator of RpoE activity)
MKTLVTVVVSAALGFVTMLWCVPRRQPEELPPTWVELPGRPVSVDGQPTRSWEEVNQALQALRLATVRAMSTSGFVEALEAVPVEVEGTGVRVTYVPWFRTGKEDGNGVESVVVRPWYPTGVPYSRGGQAILARYEIERPAGID